MRAAAGEKLILGVRTTTRDRSLCSRTSGAAQYLSRTLDQEVRVESVKNYKIPGLLAVSYMGASKSGITFPEDMKASVSLADRDSIMAKLSFVHLHELRIDPNKYFKSIPIPATFRRSCLRWKRV